MQVGKRVGPPKNKDNTLVGPELSVKETVEKTLEHMKSALDDISEQMRKFKCPSVAEVKTFDENISMNSSVVVKDLLVLDGTLDMKRVRVLKDDGCNTNVVSHEFFQKNKSCFKWKHCNVEVRHSEADSVENLQKSFSELH